MLIVAGSVLALVVAIPVGFIARRYRRL